MGNIKYITNPGIEVIDGAIEESWDYQGENMANVDVGEDPDQSFGKIKCHRTEAPVVSMQDSVDKAIRSMVELNFDAAVSVSPEGIIEGILTEKDICHKIVCQNLDPDTTKVLDVMTPNPRTIVDDCRTSIALSFMVRHSIRHLPVLSISEEGKRGTDATDGGALEFKLAGIVDISRCVFDRLDDLDQKMSEDRSIITALDVLERRGTIDPKLSGSARANLRSPDITSLLDSMGVEVHGLYNVVSIPSTSTVFDACIKMRDTGKTAVLISEEQGGPLIGIFTTKDLLSRVLAKKKDPLTTIVSSVHTHQPISVDPSVSLFSAINIMREKNIKHLPVVTTIGCVTVLEVSEVATVVLEYLFRGDNVAAEMAFSTTAWKEFWDGKKSSNTPKRSHDGGRCVYSEFRDQADGFYHYASSGDGYNANSRAR